MKLKYSHVWSPLEGKPTQNTHKLTILEGETKEKQKFKSEYQCAHTGTTKKTNDF